LHKGERLQSPSLFIFPAKSYFHLLEKSDQQRSRIKHSIDFANLTTGPATRRFQRKPWSVAYKLCFTTYALLVQSAISYLWIRLSIL